MNDENGTSTNVILRTVFAGKALKGDVQALKGNGEAVFEAMGRR